MTSTTSLLSLWFCIIWALSASPISTWSYQNSSSQIFLTSVRVADGFEGDALIHTGNLRDSKVALTNFSLHPYPNKTIDIHKIYAFAVDKKTETIYSEAHFNYNYRSLFKSSYNGKVQREIMLVNQTRYGNIQIATIRNQTKLFLVDGIGDYGPYYDYTPYYNYTQYTQPFKIKTANLDGSDLQTIFYADLMPCLPVPAVRQCERFGDIDQLAIDEENGYVYFNVEFGGGTLYRMPIAMKPNETLATRSLELLRSNTDAIRDVKFVNGTLYWLESPWSTDLVRHDQIWKWTPTYKEIKPGESLMAGKQMLSEMVNSLVLDGPGVYHDPPGLTDFAVDLNNHEIWAIRRNENTLFKVSINGGNFTEVDVGVPAGRIISRLLII